MPLSCSITLLLPQGILSCSTAFISCQPTPTFSHHTESSSRRTCQKTVKCNYFLSHITLFLCLCIYLHFRSARHFGIALAQTTLHRAVLYSIQGGTVARETLIFTLNAVQSLFPLFLFKILKASLFVFALNKLKSLQICSPLLTVRDELSYYHGFGASLCRWLIREDSSWAFCYNRQVIDLHGNSASHQDTSWAGLCWPAEWHYGFFGSLVPRTMINTWSWIPVNWNKPFFNEKRFKRTFQWSKNLVLHFRHSFDWYLI